MLIREIIDRNIIVVTSVTAAARGATAASVTDSEAATEPPVTVTVLCREVYTGQQARACIH